MAGKSSYTPELADLICDRIANGESLRAICNDDEVPVKASTVCLWLKDHPEFAEQYTRAREIQADKLFDEILEIADEREGDTVETPDGRELVNHDAIARAKLRVDARKWMAGKLRPKVYGDKIAVGGADDLPPIQAEAKSDRELAKAVAALLTGATSADG
jgi:hypothetical protein